MTKYRIKGLEAGAQVDVVCHEGRKQSRIIGSFLTVAEELLAGRSPRT